MHFFHPNGLVKTVLIIHGCITLPVHNHISFIAKASQAVYGHRVTGVKYTDLFIYSCQLYTLLHSHRQRARYAWWGCQVSSRTDVVDYSSSLNDPGIFNNVTITVILVVIRPCLFEMAVTQKNTRPSGGRLGCVLYIGL